MRAGAKSASPAVIAATGTPIASVSAAAASASAPRRRAVDAIDADQLCAIAESPVDEHPVDNPELSFNAGSPV